MVFPKECSETGIILDIGNNGNIHHHLFFSKINYKIYIALIYESTLSS